MRKFLSSLFHASLNRFGKSEHREMLSGRILSLHNVDFRVAYTKERKEELAATTLEE